MRNGDLLLSVLRGERPADVVADAWTPLLELAAEQSVTGCVYEALARDGQGSDELREACQEQEIRARLQLGAARQIAASLKSGGVPAVFVKGPALAVTVYKQLGVRPFVDLDLLVLPQDVERAHAALRVTGFALREDAPVSPIEVEYIRDDGAGVPINVDLHWDFTAEDNLQAAVRMPVGEILARRQMVHEIPVPSIEDNVLLAAANLVRKAAEPLILIVDFARLVGARPDWPVVVARAGEWGLRTPLWLGLTLAGELLGAAAPDDVRAALRPPPRRERWLRRQFAGDALWIPDKQNRFAYRVLFKAACLDSHWALFKVLAALPNGVLRKAGLIRPRIERLKRLP